MTAERSFCQDIRHLVVCSHVFYQNTTIHIRSVKHPVQTHSVRSCGVPQVWPSSFVDHLDRFSINSPCGSPSTAPHNHSIFWWARSSLVFAHLKRNLSRREHLPRPYSTNFRRKDELRHKPVVFSRSKMRYQLPRCFPPLSARRAFLR